MLGKYDSYRDSALHYLCASDWANESFGDVSTYGVYVWRISNDPADVQVINTEITSVLEEWFEANPEISETDQSFRDQLVGHFMVSENNQGQVTVRQYQLESELIQHFNNMQEHYSTWAIQTGMTNEGENY